jgi:ATP-dependent Lhr-like helicase
MSSVAEAGGFDRLHPAIQYHVVNSLGWPALRPLQERAVAPLVQGHHALLIAPTAGGKTEAAMLPVLSRMLFGEWRGLSVIYICPIKALLNNLEPRLSALAGMVGRRVEVWHGDIASGAKLRTERELPDILLTTPESLEGMLIGSRRDHRRLLGNVRCVIADELHAFAGDARGWHLLALMERMRAIGAPLDQRIGLSATVGDPAALLEWFAGHAPGKRSLVQVQAPPRDADITIDYAGSIANAAILISRLHVGEKRLVFCDSRTKVEELALALRSLGVDVFVSHAALSADIRRQAEQAFAERQNCVIVATSTLELGLDVGDLDRVIQIDAPGSVASFLQRLGRTGRRAGSVRSTLFIATTGEGLLRAVAINRLFMKGYVEPVHPPPLPYHLLVQQLFALILERGGETDEADFEALISPIPGLAEAYAAWGDIKKHLVEGEWLVVSGMRLGFGPAAEAKFRGKGLADLCVSFEAPRTFAAMHGTVLVGHVDPLSLAAKRDSPLVLALGGRSWRVVSSDWSRGRVHVVPSEEKGSSRWLGPARGDSRVLSAEVREILEEEASHLEVALSARATAKIADLREELEDTLRKTPLEHEDGGFVWWTYAGLAANLLLAGRVTTSGGTYGSVSAWSVKFTLSRAALERTGGWKGLLEVEPFWEPATRPKFADLLPDNCVHDMTLQRVMADANSGERRALG